MPNSELYNSCRSEVSVVDTCTFENTSVFHLLFALLTRVAKPVEAEISRSRFWHAFALEIYDIPTRDVILEDANV